MFENYKYKTWELYGTKVLAIILPTRQEDLISIIINEFNGQVEGLLECVNKVLSGESEEESAGHNDEYFIIHKDVTTAYDDLASLNNENLEEGEEPDVEEVDIPTLRLKEILEDYIAEKEKLGIK
ncbi:hypothetical protein FACS1894193_12600 [Bacilli bacterium]|nr:hypothetical protein FACS1894193_12600 [Bacilli bacterium]